MKYLLLAILIFLTSCKNDSINNNTQLKSHYSVGQKGLIRIPMQNQTVDISLDSLETGCVVTDCESTTGQSDISVRQDTLVSLNGICDIGVVEGGIGSTFQVVPCESLDVVYNKLSRFESDGMNFVSKLPIMHNHIYFIRNHLDSLFCIVPVGVYVGGIDRVQMFWGKLIR